MSAPTPADPSANAAAVALPIEQMLCDLLAIIHRDGGHRQDEIGIEQAWMEAMMTVPFLLEAKDRLATPAPSPALAGLADELKECPVAAMGTNKIIPYDIYERILTALHQPDAVDAMREACAIAARDALAEATRAVWDGGENKWPDQFANELRAEIAHRGGLTIPGDAK